MSDSEEQNILRNSMEIRLAPVPDKPSTILVTIRNPDINTPVTFLKWDTPLDRSALNTGVITLSDAETGDLIPGPELKLGRMLPPSREDLVEIPNGGVVSEELELISPWLPSNRKVKVHAEGRWKAVWLKRMDTVSDGELNSFSGSEKVVGSFKSLQDAVVELQ